MWLIRWAVDGGNHRGRALTAACSGGTAQGRRSPGRSAATPTSASPRWWCTGRESFRLPRRVSATVFPLCRVRTRRHRAGHRHRLPGGAALLHQLRGHRRGPRRGGARRCTPAPVRLNPPGSPARQRPLTSGRLRFYIPVSGIGAPYPGCSPAARAPALGAGDRRFESSHPERQNIARRP